MRVYVVTIYNTFADGTRYVEVNGTAYRTFNKASKMLENIGMKQSAFHGLVYEDAGTSFNLSTGRFEVMRSGLITEVEIEEE